MKHLFLLLICSTFFADTLGDVVCGPKKTSKKITLKSGEEVSFSTQAGDSYGKGVKCFAQFRRGRKDKCKLSFSCDSFELTAATSTCKKRSDFFLINKKRYCKQNGPDVSVDGRSMKVAFKSHRRSKGGAGATCTASCVSTAATTSAPGAPATTAPTTAAPACMNCSATDVWGNSQRCQFPFLAGGRQYDSCTMDFTSPGETAWCATVVDGVGNWINQRGNSSWAYCASDCPSDAAPVVAPACPYRQVGFPASCAPRHASTSKNILFLGNSYTYGNDLPGKVRALAAGAGYTATTTSVANGGWTIGQHSTGSLGSIAGGDWDVVVIQGQSQRSSFGGGYVNYYIVPESVVIVEAVRAANPCTVPLFFQTWGKRDGDSQNCGNHELFCSFEGIQDQLTQAYSTYAYVNQPAKVAPAGEAWRTYASRNGLFSGDGSHAASAGTFLTACTMFEQIWGVPCSTSSYTEGDDLKAQASSIVGDGSAWSWPQAGPPCPADPAFPGLANWPMCAAAQG